MVILKSSDEVAKMRRSGRITADAISKALEAAVPGMTTSSLDQIAEEYILAQGATSSFKGYRGRGQPPFPRVSCISLNDEVVHGIPSGRRLEDGDLLSFDFGCIWEGYHSDSASSMFIGSAPSPDAQLLVSATEEALEAAIDVMVPGSRLSDIGAAVEAVAEREGLGVINGYGGHGIGRAMHEDPHVPNEGPPGRGPLLRPGLVLAIEPMFTLGGSATKVRPDDWTVVTEDGALAAHFEHTIAITDNGNEVLT